MIRAAILTFDDCYASSVGGFADILQIANSHIRLRREQNGSDLDFYQWYFVSPSGEPALTSNGLSLQTKKLGQRDRYDLVFIPALHYGGPQHLDETLKRLAPAFPWLEKQWRAGACIAANCTGTFILAETGLLDGRVATTTWWLERQFRARYPEVDLQLCPMLTETDNLLCAGASASYLVQTIRVIERFSGPAIASQCAKAMLIDVNQTSQIPYLPLLAQRSHSDTLVQRAQHWLQDNMGTPLRIADVADTLEVSDRTLIRRFRDALDQTPLAYLQNVRLEAARTLLETSLISVDEVASQVGYGNTSSFTRLFRERMGLSPGAYRRRFQIGEATH